MHFIAVLLRLLVFVLLVPGIFGNFSYSFMSQLHFYCCEKTPHPRQLRKESVQLDVYGSRVLGSINIKVGNMTQAGRDSRHNAEAVAGSLHLIFKHEVQKENNSSIRPHLLILLKHFHKL